MAFPLDYPHGCPSGGHGTVTNDSGTFPIDWSGDDPNCGGGGGDVTGPGSSTLGHLAAFADGTGKVIEDSGFAPTDFDPAGAANQAVVVPVGLRGFFDCLRLTWARGATQILLVLTVAVGCAHPIRPSVVYGTVTPRATVQQMSDTGVIQWGMDRLYRHVQPDGPVGVVVDPGCAELNVWAYTERMGPGWLIHLGTDAHGEFLLNVLIHEHAHCLAWPEGKDYVTDFGDCGGHGPSWGIEYSRAYRAVYYDVDTPDYNPVPVPAPGLPTDATSGQTPR